MVEPTILETSQVEVVEVSTPREQDLQRIKILALVEAEQIPIRLGRQLPILVIQMGIILAVLLLVATPLAVETLLQQEPMEAGAEVVMP
jgi:hypothetical protein